MLLSIGYECRYPGITGFPFSGFGMRFCPWWLQINFNFIKFNFKIALLLNLRCRKINTRCEIKKTKYTLRDLLVLSSCSLCEPRPSCHRPPLFCRYFLPSIVPNNLLEGIMATVEYQRRDAQFLQTLRDIANRLRIHSIRATNASNSG